MKTWADRVRITTNLCMEWTGPTAGAGYGTVYFEGRRQYVHRLAYEDVWGPIPAGLEIHHRCENKICCNPFHLEAVTHAENRRLARKTYCKNGHLLSEGRLTPGHGRTCQRCDTLKKRRQRAAK